MHKHTQTNTQKHTRHHRHQHQHQAKNQELISSQRQSGQLQKDRDKLASQLEELGELREELQVGGGGGLGDARGVFVCVWQRDGVCVSVCLWLTVCVCVMKVSHG